MDNEKNYLGCVLESLQARTMGIFDMSLGNFNSQKILKIPKLAPCEADWLEIL
jgi:hypothetical protein